MFELMERYNRWLSWSSIFGILARPYDLRNWWPDKLPRDVLQQDSYADPVTILQLASETGYRVWEDQRCLAYDWPAG